MTNKPGLNLFNQNKKEENKEEIKDTAAPDIEAEATDETAEEISENEPQETNVEADNISKEFEVLKDNYDKLNNQYIRLMADFENFRKRQESERENLLKFGTENALKKMIEVLDNFERAEKALENIDDCKQHKESFVLLHKQVSEVLSKLGLEEIDAKGKEFDPNFHDAVMQTPTADYPEHTVIDELQKGYKMGDKVLRPALVNVATEA